MKRRPLSPEEFDRIERGLEEILSEIVWVNKHLEQEPTEFEREFLEAGWNRDPDLFQKFVDACKIRTQDWLDTTSRVSLVKFLARQAKNRLISRGQPVTRTEIERQVELEWGALKTNFDPEKTEYGRIAGSRSHYVEALNSALSDTKKGPQLRKLLTDKVNKIRGSVWKSVWKDPSLRDVEHRKGGRPRK